MTAPPLEAGPILDQFGLQHVQQVQPVHGGFDTAIWRVDTAESSYALRVLRPSQQASSQREVAAMQSARAAGVSTPALIAFDIWQEHPVMLLEWLPGMALKDTLESYPLRLWSLGLQFGRMQAMIHRTTAPPELLSRESAWRDWADDEALSDELRVVAPGAKTLLHQDYHPLNVKSDGQRITGVIDWTNARAGDARADFARTYTILRVEPWSANPSPGIELVRRVLTAAWWRGYEQLAGRVQNLPLFFAWAGMVMVRDLGPRVDKSDNWLEAHHLESIRVWAQGWKRRAGLPD